MGPPAAAAFAAFSGQPQQGAVAGGNERGESGRDDPWLNQRPPTQEHLNQFMNMPGAAPQGLQQRAGMGVQGVLAQGAAGGGLLGEAPLLPQTHTHTHAPLRPTGQQHRGGGIGALNVSLQHQQHTQVCVCVCVCVCVYVCVCVCLCT